jgi:hypothetical protein
MDSIIEARILYLEKELEKTQSMLLELQDRLLLIENIETYVTDTESSDLIKTTIKDIAITNGSKIV